MAKQLNVKLSMTADTSQAKTQIQSLQQQLMQLANNSFFDTGTLGLTKDIQKATQQVIQLSTQLKQATTDTGTLDLSKFNESLKKSKMSIADYKKTLVALGPEGRQAFSSLATAITTAEVPLKRTNALVQKFATSLANTARWQMSSSALHAFMGAMQTAYNYAKDLDRSLTDIQIVTEASSSYMVNFAETANKAAQSLSTSTKSYADASLIYFQQGLSEEEVLSRTDTTVKMAQATGDSVDAVSSYMTAIWNNFDDGSKSLEYYADVITKLGAATAASSSEIAEGINEFAAVAETAGLSYEYATSALTTVVATTRQSASVVGTAFKTIFARIQDLELGDTLEDGTTLGSYSKALEKIGVDIKTADGELKDMDTTLDEMGSKWNTLSNDAKVATAQAVAGTRQYTQLMALMENWDVFKENLNFAEDSEGTLTDQAEIYADSWEGARKRVQAAAESIYNDLLDEDFFKTFDDGLATLLRGVDNLIDGLGGLPGVLSLIGSIITNVFDKQIAQSLNNLAYNLTDKARKEAEQTRAEANAALKKGIFTTTTNEGQAESQSFQNQAAVQEAYLRNAEKMTEEQRQQAQLMLQINKQQNEAAIQAGKALDTEKEKTKIIQNQISYQLKQKQEKGSESRDANGDVRKKDTGSGKNKKTESISVSEEDVKNAKDQTQAFQNMLTSATKLNRVSSVLRGITQSSGESAEATKMSADKMEAYTQILASCKKDVDSLGESNSELTAAFQRMEQALAAGEIKEFEQALSSFEAEIGDFLPQGDQYTQALVKIKTALMQAGMTSSEAGAIIRQIVPSFIELGQAEAEYTERTKTAEEGTKGFVDTMGEVADEPEGIADKITKLASTLMAFSAVANSVKSMGNIFLDEDADTAQKIASVVSVLMGVLTLYTAVVKASKKAQEEASEQDALSIIVKIAQTAATVAQTLATSGLAAAITVLKTVMGGFNLTALAATVIIAGVAAAIGGISAYSQHAREELEDQAETTKEAADASKELADAAKEETDAYEDLYKQYKDAKEAKEETYEIENQLIQAARDIASAYEAETGQLSDLNVELLAATGNYEALTEAIRNNQAELLQSAKNDNEMAQGATKALFKDDMRDGVGHIIGDTYSAEFKNGSAKNLLDNENKGDKFLGQALDSGEYSNIHSEKGGDLQLEIDSDNLVEGYEEVQSLIKDAETRAAEAGQTELLAESDLYQNMKDWLEKSEESYNQIKELESEWQAISVQQSILNAQNSLDVELDSINSLEEYYKLASAATDDLTESLITNGMAEEEAAKKAEETVNQYLAANANLAEYANMAEASRQAIDEATSSEDGEENSWTGKEEELQDYYDTLSDEQKTLFVKLDFDEAESTADLDAQLDILQKEADVNTVQAKITTVNDAVSSYLEDGAESLEDSGIDWGSEEDGIIEFSEFLAMNSSSQISYLQGLSNQYQTELKQNVNEATTALKGELADTNTEIEALANDISSSIEGIDFTSGETIDVSKMEISSEDLEKVQQYNDALIKRNEIQSRISNVEKTGEETEGFSSIATMKELLDDVDADIDKVALLTSVLDESDATAVHEYNEALLEVISASDQMTGSEKIGTLLSREWSDAEKASEDYMNSVIDGMNDLEGFTLDDKMNLLANLLPEDGDIQTAMMYGAEIADIIASDETSTTEEKIKRLQDVLETGHITASQFKDSLSDLIESGDLGTEALFNLKQDETLSDSEYGQKLAEIAQNYDSCTDSLEKYYQALNSHNADQIAAAQSALELSTRSAELGEQYDIDAGRIEMLAETYREYAEGLDSVNEGGADAIEIMTDLAARDLNLNDAIEDLYDSWDDYQDILDEVNRIGAKNKDEIKQEISASAGLSSSFASLKKNTAKLLNTFEDTFDDDFVIDNLDDIKAAAEGDEEALKRLQEAAAEEIALQLDDAGVTELLGQTSEEIANWANNLPEGELGVDDTEYLQALIYAMQAAGMAQEEIENQLSGMGIDVDLEPMDQSLQDAVNAAGEAGAALAENLSYDAEAITSEDESTDSAEVMGWNAKPDTVEISGSVPSIKASEGGGVDVGENIKLEGSFPTVNVEPQVETEETQKTITTPALKVKSANKTYGGNISHSNSRSGRAARNSGRSRSGGSGRTTRRNSGQKKNVNTETERYHSIDKQLSSLEKQYDKISKAKDRAFGTSRVKLMDQEIAKQKQLIEKNKEYLKVAQDYLKTDKKNLQKGTTTYTDSNGKEQTVASGAQNYLGMSAQFDDDGNISNYEALMAAAVDKYNKAVEVFNSKNTDDEAAQLAMDAAEQQYEGFIAWLEQYEETQEIVADKAQEIIDEQNELYDKQFEKTQYILEIELEVNDKELEYLEYLLKKIEDAGDGAAEKITLLGDMAKNSFDRSDSITTSLNDMFYNGNHPELENYKGDLAADMAAGKQEAIDLLSKEEFTDEEMSFIKDQMSSLLSINEALKEAWSQVFDTMDEAFDNGVEKMDEVIAKHEHLMTMTNSWQDTIDILGKDFLGVTSETLKKYNDAKITQSKNAYSNAKTKEDTIKANIDTAQLGRDEAAKKRDEAIARGDSEAAAAWDADVKRYEESLKKYNEEFMAAQEDTASLFNESLQTMRDAFDSNLEAILDDFDTQVAGAAGSLDALLEKMDQMEMVSERYVPDYERVYQLTKLTRDLNKSIDETSNIKAKRQLMELQEEIVALQESGVEQSEYDLEYLQKRYEMKVAEIALEEAQNAKSQVRMTKDAEGNFSYVYTADEDSMAEAEQAYEDKLYELQKMNDEYQQQLSQSMAETMEEYKQKYAELADLYTVGSEEYNQALAELNELYADQMDYYSSQMENVLTNNTVLHEQDVKKYAELTGNKAMLDEEYVGSFAETTLAIAGGWTDQEEFMNNWEKATEDTYAAASAANEEFKDNVTEFMEEAGVSVEEFDEKLAEYSEEAKQDSEDLREEMEKTAEEVQEDFDDVVDGVKAFEEQYTESINNIISQNELLYKSFMQVIEAHAQFTKNTSTSGAGADDDTGGNEGNNDNGDGDGRRTNTNNADKAEGVAAAIWIWGGRKSGWGDDPERAKKLKEKGVTGAQSVLNSKANSGYLYNKYWSKRNELLTKYAYGKFDTGGYTGDWDGDGKFAMLHQKEIVLNADDTENFLKAIDVVRQISDVIDLNAMSASGGLGSLFASSVNKDNAQLEQNVHITAEFPNATNQNEILAAFDNVINLASQYANQKR